MSEEVRRRIAALRSDGDHVALAELGDELRRAEEWPLAEEALRAAYEAGSPHASLNLAVTLDMQGKIVEAEDAYRSAIDAGDSSALVQLADMLLLDESRSDEVEGLLRRGIEYEAMQAHYILGKLLARQSGRDAEAEEALRAETHPSVVPLAQMELARLLDQIPGREADAASAFAASMAEDPDSYFAMADRLYKVPGREAEAVAAMRRAAEGGVPHAWNNLTVMLKELGLIDSAEAAYRDAITAGEASIIVHFGEFLRLQNRTEEAENVLRSGLAVDPRCALVLGAMLLPDPERAFEGRELLITAASEGVAEAAIQLAQ